MSNLAFTYTGYLIIHGTHVTANNSTNNNVFFYISDYKNSITREEEIFCVTTYLETKSFKTEQPKFHRRFNFNNYSQKSQIALSFVKWHINLCGSFNAKKG